MGKNKKTQQSRRDFFKNVGLAAGTLPLLQSSLAMAQTSVAPVRVLIIPLQHGWGADREQSFGRPTGTEFNFTLPRSLQPLNTVKDQVVLVDAVRTGYWGNAHDVSYSDILTCAVSPDAPTNSSLGGPFFIPRSPSIDHVIASQHGKNVLRLSHNYASWGASYHPLSFDASLRSMPFYTTPASAYSAVIQPLQATQPAPGGQAINQELMNSLNADGNAMLARLSGTPRTRMQSYLTALTALGQRINGTASPTPITIPAPPGASPTFTQGLDHYLEMVRVCFMADTHRVAILGLGEGITQWNWTNAAGQPQVGNTFGSDFHHQIAHYNAAADPMAAMHAWTNWYAQKIAAFVQTLKTTIDVDGRPMIDNTIIVLTGEIANGNHDQRNFMHVLIGGGGAGRIRRNRWIQLPTFDPRNRGGIVWGSRRMDNSLDICGINYGAHVSRHHLSDLWVSIARLAGANINTFGFDVYNYQPIVLT